MPQAPDLSGYYATHNAIRRSNDRFVDALAGTALGDVARISALRRWFSRYAGELRFHHGNEDAIFFAALALRVPTFADYEDGLAADHARLDAMTDGLDLALSHWAAEPASASRQDASVTAAAELRDLLSSHLDAEDADVLPMFTRHFAATEYDVLNERMLASVQPRQAMFTVPWYMSSVDPDIAAATLQTAPLKLKFVYRITRARYARLVAAAFGGAS